MVSYTAKRPPVLPPSARFRRTDARLKQPHQPGYDHRLRADILDLQSEETIRANYADLRALASSLRGREPAQTDVPVMAPIFKRVMGKDISTCKMCGVPTAPAAWKQLKPLIAAMEWYAGVHVFALTAEAEQTPPEPAAAPAAAPEQSSAAVDTEDETIAPDETAKQSPAEADPPEPQRPRRGRPPKPKPEA